MSIFFVCRVSGPPVFQSLAAQSRWSASSARTSFQSFSARLSLFMASSWLSSYKTKLDPSFRILPAAQSFGRMLSTPPTTSSRLVVSLVFPTSFADCLLVALAQALLLLTLKHHPRLCRCWLYRFLRRRLDYSVWLLESSWQTKWIGLQATEWSFMQRDERDTAFLFV